MKKIILIALLLAITAGYCVSADTAGNENDFFDITLKGGLALPGFFWFEDLIWNPVTYI